MYIYIYDLYTTIGSSLRSSPSEDVTCPGTKEKFCSNSVPTILDPRIGHGSRWDLAVGFFVGIFCWGL